MMTDGMIAFPILLLLLTALFALLVGPRLTLRPQSAGMLLALAPLTAFGVLLARAFTLAETPVQRLTINWLSSLNWSLGLYFDALAALFALIVTGIGTLIVLYTGQYFSSAGREVWRFYGYILLFMTMMLGLVLAGDIVTLFIFWEGTSITSFLLVAFKSKDAAARRGAFKALFITGGGGVALLAGLLFTASIAGGNDFGTLLAAGDVLRASPLYLLALGLVAFGAFTKSAQVPAHIWLPDAMSAPTPASAYLHSATMVKAGIYLMARLNPALGETEAWFWLLSVFGMLTMLTGAWLGTRQDDLKALLAYSTVSQLGALMMLIGQDTEIAFKAFVIGVLAHALYKSALFMAVGIVDHEAGTRLISRLGGLRHAMPWTFAITAVAALSLAGLPPLLGFLAKETLIATAVHPSLPQVMVWVFSAAVVVAAALKLVQAGLLALDVFLRQPRDANIHAHEAPRLMLLAPALPALGSLALGVLPEPPMLADFMGQAAAAAYGAPVKVSFALWTGLNIPLLLSAIAIASGALLFLRRAQLIALQARLDGGPLFNRLYEATLNAIDGAAWGATRLQAGQLRRYLAVILVAMLTLVVLFGGVALPTAAGLNMPSFDLAGELALLQVLALVAVVGAALATVVLRRDFAAVLALSISGLGVALYMAVEPAPDVALVQIVVDILATVILVLALTRLPRRQRTAAGAADKRPALLNLLAAVGGGLLVTLITLSALVDRPRSSSVTPFYEANSLALTGASDIVGAIIVDFRALDTVIEIAVFGLAGLGVYTLLTYGARKHDDHGKALDALPALPVSPLPTLGIGGERASQLIRLLANLLLPLALLVGMIHMVYGHVQPGDGFTAGVIISLAVGFKVLAYGYVESRLRLPWLRAFPLLSGGVLLVLTTGTLASWLGGHFLASIDFGALVGLPLPTDVKLSSGFLFEVAIALTVLGSTALMLEALGRPVAAGAGQMPAPQAETIEGGAEAPAVAQLPTGD